MTRNAAGFADAPCVSYYQEIRDGVRADARQIGYGVNKRPVPPVVVRQLHRLHEVLFEDRITDYDRTDDVVGRMLIAALAGRYLGVSGLTPDHVVLSHGTTEAISIVLHHAKSLGLRLITPLPNYYAFEQSASRAGVPVAAHYGPGGASTALASGDRTLRVDVGPNGVLGTWFSTPPGERPALRLVDHVFALPSFAPHYEVRRELAVRCGALTDTAVCLTPSKDLSIPGLRCGLLVTRDPGLLAYAAADRFERGYAVQASVAPVVATHLALLLLSSAPRHELIDVHRDLAEQFTAAGVPFLTEDDTEEFVRWCATIREAFLRNLSAFDERHFLLPVPGAETPVAGYSTFRWLDVPFESPRRYTRWIRDAGRRGLKLNPNLLFGGDVTAWESLYPGRCGIRLNLSVDPGELRADLDLLESMVLEAR